MGQVSHRENVGGFSVNGYEWATELLVAWLRVDRVTRRAAQEVMDQHVLESRQEFWLAKFLWDALYGTGLPWSIGPSSVNVTQTNFTHADFAELRVLIHELEGR